MQNLELFPFSSFQILIVWKFTILCVCLVDINYCVPMYKLLL
jgi:hypothetical protein